MRAVVQRVSRSEVLVEGECVGRIGRGFLVLLGVAEGDTPEQASTLAAKISKLRIFEDDGGKMNLSLREAGGSVLAVSQFTLLADTRKGNRPSFARAARPESARPLYERFCRELADRGLTVERGVFGARMEVRLVNDGPVTLILDA